MHIVKSPISIVLLVVSSVANAATTYLDETEYLNALAAIPGTTVIEEGFEDNTVWAASRTPSSTPEVNSQGILWTSNFATNDISTGGLGGSTHEGIWGFFSNPHGDPDVVSDDRTCDVPDPIPDVCFLHDGFKGTSAGAGKLNGVGAWIDGSVAGVDITVFLDGVDVGGVSNISGWTFFGVIDTAGFDAFEFREIGGKGGQQEFIFGDDFNIGVSAVPVPAAVWLFGSGLLGLIGIARRKKA